MSDNRNFFLIEVRITSSSDFAIKEEAKLNKEIAEGVSKALAKISDNNPITFDTPKSQLMEWKGK